MHINSNLLSAQNRDRFYCFNWTVKSPIDKKLILKDIILPPEEVEEKYWYKDKSFTFLDSDKSVCATLDIKGMDNIKRIYNIEYKSPTLTCDGKGGHRVKKILQEGIPRKLTPLEYERLQTLPDGYTAGISDSQRYNVIGNCWTADIIIHILREGLKNVPKDEEIVVLSMYDGISVGRYCLEKLGYKNVKYYSIEIDEYAKTVSLNNYPDIIQCGDAFQLRDNTFNIDDLLSTSV